MRALTSRSTLVLCGADTAQDFPNGDLQAEQLPPASSTPCTGLTHTESLSLSNRTPGCWIPNVPFDHHLLHPAYEEVSPAESQALCPRLNKMDLGCKVLEWETNQSGWVKPAVTSLILQCQYWVRVPWLPRTSTHWCECSHWERQVLEEDTKMTCPWKNWI